MANLSINEMEKYAQKFLSKNFNLELTVPISLNNRLTRSLGRFIYKRSQLKNIKEPLGIEISSKFLKYNSNEDVLDTLKHELIHYALFMLDEPFLDHDKKFIETCKKLGVGLTGSKTLKSPKHEYKCPHGCLVTRHRRFNINRYVCKAHKASFELIK